MGWGELARATLQSILEEQGGIVVAVIIFAFVSTLVLFWSFWNCNRQLKKKDRELERMAKQKAKLENLFLERRLSSIPKKRPKN